MWIAGFTSGDGCFKVSISAQATKLHKAGSRVVLLFIITQHIRDELLLKGLIDYFGCGNTYSYKEYTEFSRLRLANHSKITMKKYYLSFKNILSLV